MKKFRLYLLLCVPLLATGCPRYDTVRKLSTEQLRIQQDLHNTMTKYFASMEQFADNQINVDARYYDNLLRQDLELDKEDFDEAITAVKNDAARTPEQKAAEIQRISIAFGTANQIKRATNERDKEELRGLLQQYKNKNREILATYQAILDAQTELDRYIQLKKADEVITDQLLGKLRLNQNKLTRLFDETADVAGKLKVKPPAPVAAAQ